MGEAKLGSEDEPDSFELIDGIGPTWANALHRIGIHHFADLAQATPEELAQLLHQQLGMNVSARTIHSKNWIGQAQKLTEQAAQASDTPAQQPMQNIPERLHNNWEQHAGFSLFFGTITDAEGSKLWRARLYHEESGDEAEIEVNESARWMDWIGERVEAIPGIELAAPAASGAAPNVRDTGAARIMIRHVQVQERQADTDAVPSFNACVDLQLSGADIDEWVARHPLVRVEIRLMSIEGGPSLPLSFRYHHLRTSHAPYTLEQPIPAPEPGEYDVRAAIYAVPQGDLLCESRGTRCRIAHRSSVEATS